MRSRLPGLIDVVPAARTVVVLYEDGHHPGLSAVAEAVTVEGPAANGQADAAPVLEIPVVYDGVDLSAVAGLLGISRDELVSRHSAREYVAAFCGFVPGFAYLTGLDEGLMVPRLASPRVRVPAGSVAIAEQYTAVYPRSSPGGWRLIGRTALTLFDAHRQPPAMISAATRVRFRPVTDD
jgi:KipI family sensor histidine kinase inhibitor